MEKTAQIVVDASVAIKWFIEEHNSEIANQVKEDYQKRVIDITIPDLLAYEVLNVLRYKLSMGEIDLRRIVKDLDDFQLGKASFEGSYSQGTISSSLKHGITVYDAAYASLAEIYGWWFLTADEKLTGRIKGQEKVILLKDYPAFRETLFQEEEEEKMTTKDS